MLGLEEDRAKMDNSPVPAMSMKQAELVEKIKKEEESQEKKGVSLVVVGTFLPNALKKSAHSLPHSQGMLTPENLR